MNRIRNISIRTRIMVLVFLAMFVSNTALIVTLSYSQHHDFFKLITPSLGLKALIIFIIFEVGAALISEALLVRPLKQGVKLANSMAENDLSAEIRTTRQGEAGQMIQSLQKARDNLKHLIATIQSSSERVTLSSEELNQIIEQANGQVHDINEGVKHLLNVFTQNAESMKQTAVAISEITNHSQTTAELANQIAERAQLVMNSAEGGKQSVDSIVEAINELAANTKHVSGEVLSLEEQSQKITEVVSIIKQISEQTHLLALNAAIEAARAGEEGRGFAVVAGQIRKLAEDTNHSLQEIGSLVQDMTVRTGSVVAAVTQTEEKVREGVTQSENVKTNIEHIIDNMENTFAMLTEISGGVTTQAASLEEMTATLEDVNGTIESGLQVSGEIQGQLGTQEKIFGEIEKTSGKLVELSENMNGLTNVFKL
ncbi:methyl-accepting chemotaxis protein [Paenibacillus sp. MBLB2552]|uniref:Methyl-accepting chemotaxis protein n=1 Tax=Paenibacillus mellifer TaxID=2937794 RepID=A0A9X2BTV5_9BACL|nr:HAMP domain-containing methyl-accepting chemotaxis protein [Paenibacillus mellifer]MCK8489860.1 methyl-accepting chemotaxis protein [Paenibacillus mellifer]